jgi:hypothetical protein
VLERRLIRAIVRPEGWERLRESVFESEGGREEDAQNEVDVVAEEGTQDERECAPGEREQKHVHGRHFVLG